MASEWNVGALMAVSGGYWRGCTLQAAVRLKIFTALGSGSSDAVEVAQVIGGDIRATGLLLDALAAMGLLVKKEGCYTNSDFAAQFLVADVSGYMGHIILHHHHILDGWAQLDRAVLTGKQVSRRSYGTVTERESFLLGMFNVAMGIAPKLVAEFSLAGRRRLLDLGGGPGTYAIHFCLANPGLSAVILDRPSTEPYARETVARFGLADRIDFAGGDFNVDPISGGPYDVAWLSHILHSNTLDQCQECINKTVAVLEPGGLLLVHDFILDDTGDHPEFAALFSLNMLVGTEGGRSYSRAEIYAMMANAGLDDIHQRKLPVANDSSVISGIKR